MTAPQPKTTITPERIDWFAAYYSKNGAWGVFHVWLDDKNWKMPFVFTTTGEVPADVLEAGNWFAQLSPSQKRRLGEKAEDRAYELGLLARRNPGPSGTVRVTKVDERSGTITVTSHGR